MPYLNKFGVRDQFYDTGSAFKLPANFTTTTTTETAFLLSNGAVAAIAIPQGNEVEGSAAPGVPSGVAALLGANESLRSRRGENRPYYSAAAFDGRPFRLRASGYFSGGGTTLTSVTCAIKLYQGSSATLGSDTAIAAPTAMTAGNINGNWFLDARFLWDSTSNVLNGVYQFFGYGNGGTVTNITNTACTQVATTTIGGLSFVLSYSFATSSTANAIGLRSFYFTET